MRKTIYLIVSFIFLLGNSKAQKARIGITAGTTFSTYKAKVGSVSITSKSKVGFTVGVTSYVPLGQNFSFQPALNFVQKGGILKENGMKDKSTLNYLEVPMNFAYNLRSSKGKLFIGAGPSLSLGLSGKDRWEVDGISRSEKIKFGKGDDKDFKALEAGINFITGYQSDSGILLALNYNAGLSNLVNSSDGFNGKYHNRYVGIRLGYMLGR